VKEKMTDPEVARIRARHQEGLRKGMTNAEASAYANEGLTPSPKDEVTRTRQRFYNAQRRGMSIAEATAYANNRDVAEPSVGAGAQVELADAPSSAESSANPQSHLVGDSGPVEKAASPPLQPTLSACTDHAGLVHYPDREVLQALLAHNFNAFGEFAFSAVRPGVPLKRNWHLEAMAEKLAQVTSGKIRRLLISLPPRHLKSLYASVALPAWFLGHNPWERVVVASYSDLLARNHASDFRRLVNDPLYQATFPGMRLARDTDREITTTERGKRIATSIAGTLTGLGGNLFIIDDPLKAGDAMSESVRAQVIEWYRSTLLSRGDDKTAMRIVVVMQRVHENDLVGYLLEQGGFEVLNLPAIAQRDETFDLGGGRTYWRQKGELLHPEHEPADALIELKRNMGPFAFSAQYQQSPIPPGGTIIKRKWLKTYDNIQYQAGDQIIMSWDIALSETESGDYAACVVLLRRGEVFYVLEVIRGRFPFDTLKRKVMEVKERYGAAATLLIEDSPISRGLIQSLRGKWINVAIYRPETDKRARAIAQTDLFAGGSVLLPQQAGWLEEFVAELVAFPGRHDDQVDALTQGLAQGRHDWAYRPSWGRYRGHI
jgi:predicted phage terminase large subunit-like protein